jgi:uncharacterized RDD family membrane protein YckC
LVYFAAFEAACGASPGKLVAGLRVVTEDGASIGPVRALCRTLFKALSYVFPLLFLMPIWTRRRQALHDMMSYCLVVRV